MGILNVIGGMFEEHKKKQGIVERNDTIQNNVVETKENDIASPESIIEEFITEVDRIKEDAKARRIPTTMKEEDAIRRKTLYDMGFSSSETRRNFRNNSSYVEKENKEKDALLEAIDYFSKTYPNNKFITTQALNRLARKYNLIAVETYFYFGVIPYDNIDDMSNFKLDESNIPFVLGNRKHRSILIGTRKECNDKLSKLKEDPNDPYEIVQLPALLASKGESKSFCRDGITPKVLLHPVLHSGGVYYLIVTHWIN